MAEGSSANAVGPAVHLPPPATSPLRESPYCLKPPVRVKRSRDQSNFRCSNPNPFDRLLNLQLKSNNNVMSLQGRGFVNMDMA